jgi:hypothetical protein
MKIYRAVQYELADEPIAGEILVDVPILSTTVVGSDIIV